MPLRLRPSLAPAARGSKLPLPPGRQCQCSPDPLSPSRCHGRGGPGSRGDSEAETVAPGRGPRYCRKTCRRGSAAVGPGRRPGGRGLRATLSPTLNNLTTAAPSRAPGCGGGSPSLDSQQSGRSRAHWQPPPSRVILPVIRKSKTNHGRGCPSRHGPDLPGSLPGQTWDNAPRRRVAEPE